MKRDFRTVTILLVFSLPVLAIIFISSLYFFNCGPNANCSSASLAPIIHTPIPSLFPATLPVSAPGGPASPAAAKCSVSAETILGAWVNAGSPETQPFSFQDTKNNSCSANFTDLQPLFNESNLWYSGAPACITCHNSSLSPAYAQMDLSSYAGIVAGSHRSSSSVKGTDILGGGNWDQSKLNQMLFVLKLMPFGRPPGAVPDQGPVIQAGTQAGAAASAAISTTPSALSATLASGTTTPSGAASAQVPLPSNTGGPGVAINLKGDASAGAQVYQFNCAICHGPQGTGGVPNPGSTDGTVPPLNPIDPGLVNVDYGTFAKNVDLFIQHGSRPDGPNPSLSMPAWGDQTLITQQQIANVIAFVIGLNQAQISSTNVTPTPATTATPPLPSNQGSFGMAINLTGDVAAGKQVFQINCVICHGSQGKGGVPNPGSTDGSIPSLNPIDPALANPDFNTFARNIDLFIQHGSLPAGASPIFSMPAWGDQSLLTQQQIANVIAYVTSLNGVQAPVPTPTPTQAAGVAASVPLPSNPGGPGGAVSLTGNAPTGEQIFQLNCAICHGDQGKGGVPNPGSTDGSVPPLNPIDPGLVNPDPAVFAKNIDLFIQHGSRPDGTSPVFSMPAWGDQSLLTQQQIADVIAYVTSLNK
jgi:mono/diheme cytochrome c family protein